MANTIQDRKQEGERIRARFLLPHPGRFPRRRAQNLRGPRDGLGFHGAVSVIVIWGLTGHIFHYSDTWQLIINTGTTIVTFLMVFLIQNTQNRDSQARFSLKLDELIRSMAGARNKLMDLEALADEDLDEFQKEFERLRKRSEQTADERLQDQQDEQLTLKRAPRRERMNFGPEGQSRSNSQFVQSGLRAKQRRRPCQMSQ